MFMFPEKGEVVLVQDSEGEAWKRKLVLGSDITSKNCRRVYYAGGGIDGACTCPGRFPRWKHVPREANEDPMHSML